MSGKLSTDIYEISEFIQELKEKHIPAENSNSLLLGIFGYLGDVHSTQIQSNIIMSSEWMDEVFPIRAKLEKNLLTHAMMANITDFTAIPAKMEMLLCVRETDLLANMVNDVLIIDKKTPINIGNFEFHLEYDVKITKPKVSNNKDIYVAQYDLIGKENKLSTITNPYLLPPVVTKINNENFIAIKIVTRQIEMSAVHKKIISNDNIENRTLDFTFENQLADFYITVTSNDGTEITITPIYDNSPIVDYNKKHCYYSYLNLNTIRVRFIPEQYTSKINDEIMIHITTTRGSTGNFTYKSDIIVEPKSDKIAYNNLLLLAKPITPSRFGEDKKTIEQLQKMIPVELLSRGSITCTKDLDNFFNKLNDKNNRLLFLEKINNQLSRKYYSYILLKDSGGNVIPTNTINLKLYDKDFDKIENRLVLKPGAILEYDADIDRAERISNKGMTTSLITKKESDGFLYTSPFTTVVNKSPLVVSTYLTIFDKTLDLLFNYINDTSILQFISTSVEWKRDLLNNNDTYKLDIELYQNIDEDMKLVEVDDIGFITSSKIKTIGVFYDKNGHPLRYTEGLPLYYDKKAKSYKFRFNIKTDDDITRDSTIKLTNLYDINTTDIMNAYVPAKGTSFKVFVLADTGRVYNENELTSIVPNIDVYTLCNVYEIDGGLDFFINFSSIISSKVRVERDTLQSPWHFKLDSVPVVRYSYLNSSARVKYLINYILNKKDYIDMAVNELENSFGVDFKFFNAYGPSKVYKIGHNDKSLSRVNLSIHLAIKFSTTSNNESFVDMVKKEIKNYIEDVDRNHNIHFLNIATHLKEKFSFISYIEFIGINEYTSDYQSILENIEPRKVYVPEFININSKEVDYVPDINIKVL